jgi:hypothetical protein
MALGSSLFLLAVGAILAFAVNATVAGVDITTIGVILMVVGLIGILMSMLFFASFAPFYHGEREGRRVVRRDVVEREL